jgi:hypothetical protein
VRRARNSQKRRFPARAVLRMIGYCVLMAAGVYIGAHDRASPNFMGLASLGLEIGVFCQVLYSVLLSNAILGLYFLGLALYRPQVYINTGFLSTIKGTLEAFTVRLVT